MDNNDVELDTTSQEGLSETNETNTSLDGGATVDSSNTNSESSSANESTDEKRRNVEAERGRISAYEKKIKAYESQMETIDNSLKRIFKRDPEGFNRFRDSYQAEFGVPFKTYEELFGDAPDSKPSQQATATQQRQPSTTGLTEEQVRATVRAETAQQKQLDEATTYFIQQIPDMAPDATTEEQAQAKVAIFKRSFDAAMGIMAANRNSGMTLGEALVRGYYSLSENADKQMADATRRAELKGRATALATGSVGTIQPGSNVSSRGAQLPAMNDAQRATYERLLETKGQKIADSYASKLS